MIPQSPKHPIRVLHMIATLEMGGSQVMVLNLYKAINRENIQFDFIIDHPDRLALKDEIERLGGKIFILPTFTGKNLPQVIKAWDSFFMNHREYKVLHTHSRSYAAVYLTIAKKYGLVTIAHSHSTSNGKGIKAHIKDIMQVPIRYQADYLFACSQEAADWLFGKKAAKSERCYIIPNAIESKNFQFNIDKRAKIRNELGITDQFVVGHIGRMTQPKNHVFLFRCFKELLLLKPNALMLLVGDGELRESLEQEAKGLGIYRQIFFLGEKTNVSDYVQAMDAFAFPSLWEGLGIAVIEAQAAGLPCVVSDRVPKTVDVGAELVTFLSLNSSPFEWAKAMKNITRKDTSDALKKSGYDIHESAIVLQKFYEEIGI